MGHRDTHSYRAREDRGGFTGDQDGGGVGRRLRQRHSTERCRETEGPRGRVSGWLHGQEVVRGWRCEGQAVGASQVLFLPGAVGALDSVDSGITSTQLTQGCETVTVAAVWE